MIWEAVIVVYLALGFVITWAADEGHKRRYGAAISWWTWLFGVVGWPIIFLIAGRMK